MDFPALRARAHLSAPDGAVDYGPDGPVDYAPDGAVDYGPDGPVDYACWRMLWISQHFVLGRIYPHLTVLWITWLRHCGLRA